MSDLRELSRVITRLQTELNDIKRGLGNIPSRWPIPTEASMRNPITGQIAGPVPGVTIDGAQVYTVNLYPAGPYTKTGSIYTPTIPTVASVIYLDSNTADTLTSGQWVDVWQQNGLYYTETPVTNPNASTTGASVDFWCDLFDRADQPTMGPYWIATNGTITSNFGCINPAAYDPTYFNRRIATSNYNIKIKLNKYLNVK